VDDATAGSSPDVSRQLPALDVAGLWAVGGTQVTRCTLHWQVAGSGQDLAQEVRVLRWLVRVRPHAHTRPDARALLLFGPGSRRCAHLHHLTAGCGGGPAAGGAALIQ
jgi:hypothetical protein